MRTYILLMLPFGWWQMIIILLMDMLPYTNRLLYTVHCIRPRAISTVCLTCQLSHYIHVLQKKLITYIIKNNEHPISM